MHLTALYLLAVAAKRPLNDQILHYEPLRVNHEALGLGTDRTRYSQPHLTELRVPLTVFDQEYELDLKHAGEFFHPEATIHRTNANGQVVTTPLNTAGYFMGRLYNTPKSHANIHIDEVGHIRGHFGIAGGDTHYVAPAVDHFDTPQSFEHVVWREADMKYNGTGFDNTPDPVPPPSNIKGSVPFDGDALEATMRRQRRAQPFSSPQTACTIALFVDPKFIEISGGNTFAGAVSKAVQRFLVVAKVFSTIDASQNAAVGSFSLVIGTVTDTVPTSQAATCGCTANDLGDIEPTDTDLSGAPNSGYKLYLEMFSRGSWSEPITTNLVGDPVTTSTTRFCVAHAFTDVDFDGTLGLAWVGDDSPGSNAGICAGSLNQGGFSTTMNTGWSTSTSRGDTVPELMASLVAAHEIGHNFGGLHPCEKDTCGSYATPADGYFIMYFTAQSGYESNNQKFRGNDGGSQYDNQARILDVIAAKGGCFANPSAPTSDQVFDFCGNAAIDNGEVCDCGDADTQGKCDLVDACCRFDSCSSFKAGSECTPQASGFNNQGEPDPNLLSGKCCKSDCSFESAGTECLPKGPCQAATQCNSAGKCNTGGGGYSDNVLCDNNNFEACASGSCSGLCMSGECTKSVCEAVTGYIECPATKYFGSESCQIMCLLASNPTGDCVAFNTLSPTGISRPPGSSAPINNIDFKPTNAECAFIEGKAGTGLCSSDNECVSIESDESAIDELNRYFENAKEAFTDWATEETAGLPNYGWLIIGFFLLMGVCITGCYYANRSVKLQG